MRALTCLLTFAFVLAGPSFAGTPEGSLPGIGTFQYSGSQIVSSSPEPLVLAARF